MMLRKLLLTGILLAACFLSVCPGMRAGAEEEQQQERTDPRARAFAHVAASAAGLKTIASDFVQEKYSSMLREPLVSTGRFVYEKPDRLYWDTFKPSRSGFMVNGDKAVRWGKDRSAAETFDVQKEPFIRAIAEQVSAWSRADFPWLEKRYKITVTGSMPQVMKLYPLSSQEKKYMARLLVTFSDDWSHVVSVEIFEREGDRTRIIFKNVILNEPVPEDVFAR